MVARMAMFIAGFPETTTLASQNRFCSSGLQSVMTIANAITSREIDIGIGCGAESMSMYSMKTTFDESSVHPSILTNEKAKLCLMPMGITSENVVAKYGITREKQD